MSASRTSSRTFSWPLFLAVFVALNWTFIFVQAFWQNPERYDFGAFYRSGQAWNAGVSAYNDTIQPNLNPPWLLPIIFGPLARLPLSLAVGVWFAISGIACWRSFVLIRRALQLTIHDIVKVGVGVALTYSWLVGWEQGQIGWILFWLVTEAWVWAREGQRARAGALFGVVVAIKPTMALAALPLGWITLLVAAVTSSGIAALSLLWTGVSPWQEWMALSGTIQWYSAGPNTSLIGELARLTGAGVNDSIALNAIPSVWLAIALLVAVAIVWRSCVLRDLDQRWAAGLLQSVILSPLGWTFYLPLALGPYLAITRERRAGVLVPWTLLVAQNFLQPFATAQSWTYACWGTLGSGAAIYAWLFATIQTSAMAPDCEHQEPERLQQQGSQSCGAPDHVSA